MLERVYILTIRIKRSLDDIIYEHKEDREFLSSFGTDLNKYIIHKLRFNSLLCDVVSRLIHYLDKSFLKHEITSNSHYRVGSSTELSIHFKSYSIENIK